MRIKGAKIKDYKRFTDLTIEGIPITARLIMLAGPNGSGKILILRCAHEMAPEVRAWRSPAG